MLSDRQRRLLAILEHRCARARTYLDILNRREARYPWLRLGAAILVLLGGYLAFQFAGGLLASLITLGLVALFVVITIAHRRVIDAATRMAALERLLTVQVARATLDWPGIPAPAPVSPSADHSFDRDLLVTGPNSLHHLIDIAGSSGGSYCLASWLLAEQPKIEQAENRQQLVREMAALPGLRTRLMVESELLREESGHPRWDTGELLRWVMSRSAEDSLRRVVIILFALAAANLVFFLLNSLAGLLPLWILSFLVYFGVQASRTRESSEVFTDAYSLARSLGQLRRVLVELEKHPHTPGSALARLCAPVWKGPQQPSTVLKQVNAIASAASLRQNPALALLLNILVPWDLFFAYLLEVVKRRMRGLLPAWLDVLHEVEGVHSLANFAVLNPDYTFPVILPTDRISGKPAPGQPVVAAQGLAHPLIPPAVRVSNDFSLPELGQVGLITGSNMSGKSTFLRTVGANLVLAYAGSVVCAAEMRAIPLRLYTSMNVADSLTDGISFFYAEVRRLKTLLDLLNARSATPLFFLIDEIFRGTNNRERRIGSESYVRALAGAHGSGLISTHDLELVALADEIPQVRNYHFREDIQDEKMVFDYHLRPGPSPTTNALRIMALAGLPVGKMEKLPDE